MPRAQPGQRFGGRQKGTPNKITGNLKEAIVAAAASVGYDGKGQNGIEGYLKRCAENDEKTYLGILGRVLPHMIEGNPDKPLEHKMEVVFVSATKE